MIVLLGLGVVLLAYTLLQYTHHYRVRWMPLITGLLLIGLNGFGLWKADEYRWFMQPTTIAKTDTIQPVGSLGSYHFVTTTGATGKERYTYKEQGKTFQTLPDPMKMAVTHTAQKATLTTTLHESEATDTWQNFMRLCKKKLIINGTSYQLALPKDWQIVTKQQYKLLESEMQGITQEVAKATEKRIKAELDEKLAEDDEFATDKEAQKKLKRQIVKEETGKVTEKIDAKVAAKLKEWR